MKGLYRIKAREFSMRSNVEILLESEGFVFGFIRQPESWKSFLSDKPFTMSKEQFKKEYRRI